jgi:cytochrome c-type biogenesis protein CcmH
MRAWLRLLTMAMMLATSAALAVEPSEILADPKLEARARALSANLRCLVCQNQSIDDSNAPLAKDLRMIVRERLTAGDSDRQVTDFLVARYGDFILLKPPLKAGTVLLWGAPFVVLLAGMGMIFLVSRRRRQLEAAAPLSPEEMTRLSSILDKKSP